MLIRAFTGLMLALAPIASPVFTATPSIAQAQPLATAELMRATALDVVFTQFGAAIATSARSEEISTDETFLHHWEATAESVFDADALHKRLATALDGQFSAEDQVVLGTFFRSDFGKRMTVLEREVALLPPAQQLAAIGDGQQLIDSASTVRAGQIEQLMKLVSAEISAVMVGQSVRALLLGLSVSHQQGDISVPWEEIDTQVEAMMPGLLADVGRSQRAMMAYAYRDLTDAELDEYLRFLGTPAAQNFYAIAAYAVGRIVAEGMSDFGEAFAARMKSVNI